MATITELMNRIPQTGMGQNPAVTGTGKTGESQTVNFSDTIKEFLSAVNNSQKESAGSVADVVEGRSENLAEAMTTMEESRLNFQLLLEIRSRLLDSYKEIQRMQV